MMFLVAASRRGVGFLVKASYCDVIVSAFFTYASRESRTKPLHLSDRLIMRSGAERKSLRDFTSSLDTLAWPKLRWFLKQFIILRFRALSDPSVAVSAEGAILVSMSLNLGVMLRGVILVAG